MVLPVVTPENYYSPEMNMAYMGSTQFKAFERCEAAALAELKGEYSPPSSAALLVGGYIDAWFSGELPLYQAQHPEIFKRDGTLKAEYVKATEVVARLQADDLYSLLMSGKKQVIRTGTIAGVPFKIKIDSLLDADTCAKIVAEFPNAAAALGLCDGAIVDQKAILNAAEVRSGTWGELWLDGEQVAECYGCQIKVNKTKDDVTRCRTLVAGKKMTAVSITGTIRIYNATSRLIKLEAEALKQGKDLRHTIISNLDDPDNADNQRIAVKGVSFDDLTLADWQAAQLGQIEAPFTAEDYTVMDS